MGIHITFSEWKYKKSEIRGISFGEVAEFQHLQEEEKSFKPEGTGEARAQTETLDKGAACKDRVSGTLECWGMNLQDIRMHMQMSLDRQQRASESSQATWFVTGKEFTGMEATSWVAIKRIT